MGQLQPVNTKGPGEVRDLLKIDEQRQEVWVSATFDSKIERHTYRVSLNGKKRERVTEWGWDHTTRISPSGNFLIDTCSRANQPAQTRLLDRKGNLQRLLNPNVPDRLRHVQISSPEFMRVETRDGYRLDAMLIVPPDFDPSKTTIMDKDSLFLESKLAIDSLKNTQASLKFNLSEGNRYKITFLQPFFNC